MGTVIFAVIFHPASPKEKVCTQRWDRGGGGRGLMVTLPCFIWIRMVDRYCFMYFNIHTVWGQLSIINVQKCSQYDFIAANYYLHCPKNNCNLRNKAQPVHGTNAAVNVRFFCLYLWHKNQTCTKLSNTALVFSYPEIQTIFGTV